MNTLKKYWPLIAHGAVLGAVYALPMLKAFAATHPAYDGLYIFLAGMLLHRAQSPVASSGSKF